MKFVGLFLHDKSIIILKLIVCEELHMTLFLQQIDIPMPPLCAMERLTLSDVYHLKCHYRIAWHTYMQQITKSFDYNMLEQINLTIGWSYLVTPI